MTETTDLKADRIQTWNEVTDEAKYRALVDSMDTDGWTGAPVIIIEREDADPLAVTGSHRIAAAREAGFDVPTVNLADLLAEHGADLDAIVAEYTDAGLDRDDAVYEAIIRAVDYLPADVVDYYGLDAH